MFDYIIIFITKGKYNMIAETSFFIISLLFPVLIYFIYLVYSDLNNSKEKDYILDLVLLTSFYLPIIQGYLSVNNLLLINIPLVISMIKRRNISSFLLIILLLLQYHTHMPSINLIYFIIEYLIIFIVLNVIQKYEITFFLSIKFLFIIFYTLVLKINVINVGLLNFILNYIIIYLIFTAYKYIYFKLETIVSLRKSISKTIKEQKQLQNLFKITHEVKNPLAVCKGYLQMINFEDIKKSQRYVDIISKQIDKTLEIIKDFSNISNLKIEEKKVNLNILLKELEQEISVFNTSHIRIKTNYSTSNIIVMADSNRLKQVLLNIIKNANEAILNKGVINITLYEKKNLAYIEVCDNGIGMDYETLNNLYTPFFTTKKNGTGLGVCLSKEIIEKHGGNIEYHSKENKGTKVIIKLPLKKTSI